MKITKIVSFWLIIVLHGVSLPVFPQVRPQDNGKGVQTKPITQLPAKDKRWALIIGVDNYEDENIGDLRGAANDAKTLAESLERYAGFDGSQIVVLTTNEPRERQPTRANILKRLSNLKGLVPKDGLLLVSFSGHGIERGNRAFLIPSDATSTDDVDLLEETAISVESMRRNVKNTQVQQVLFLLDACRNDPTSGKAETSNPLTEAYKRGFSFDVANKEIEAFATIYATSVGTRAYEYTEKKQGYFSWAVIEALSGKAANANGEVTLGSLVRYVAARVPKMVAVDLGVSRLQRPFAEIAGYNADDLVLSIGETKPLPVPVASPMTEIPTAKPGKSGEQLFWEDVEKGNTLADYESYLQSYPNGQFAELAKRRISVAKTNAETKRKEAESGAWETAQRTNTITAYENFKRDYPASDFKALAERRITTLREAEKTKLREAEAAKLRNPTKGSAIKRQIANGVEMEFVGIPAGTFMMGSPTSEKDRSDDETQHRVTITNGYWLGKYEVTIGEWKAVMGDLPEGMKTNLDAKFYENERQPVVRVSWEDVREFIQKLNAKGEGKYRLPTEAEWEYAARGGMTTAFSFGNSLDASQANFDGNYPYGNGAKGRYLEKTAPVGSYQVNDYGLYDMHGNVWEWCQDWYGNYSGAAVTDPSGPASVSLRVFRGGGWIDYARNLRSANRLNNTPSFRYYALGFRLIRE